MDLLAVSLNGPASFFNWGFISISVPNLIMIGLIVLLFILALVVPFPQHRNSANKSKIGM
jgi:hypothetical protein